MVFRGKARSSVDVAWHSLGNLDLIWGVVAPILALWVRDGRLFHGGPLTDGWIYVVVGGVLTAASFSLFRVSHRLSRFFSIDDALIVFLASAVAVMSTVLVCFLLTRLDNVPRALPILHFVILLAGNIGARTVRYLRRRWRDRPSESTSNVENLIVVGVCDLAWYYVQIVEQVMSDRYAVVALVDERKKLQGRYVHGYPVVGRISDIETVLAEYDMHGVEIGGLVLAVEPTTLARELVDQVFDAAKKWGIEVSVMTERLCPASEQRSAGMQRFQTATPQNKEWCRDPVFWGLKRTADIVLSAFLLAATLPIIALIYLGVLLDRGMPILYWQVRVGHAGRRIAIYKFRTLLSPFTSSGESVPMEQRISRFGRMLRRAHLDELPQLFAVLMGRMSLIGPRPLLPIDLPEEIGLRLAVRPGITGWAQVNGATLITPEEKNAMDEWYVRHASWRLELWIAVATVRALFMPMRRNEAAITAALQEQSNYRQTGRRVSPVSLSAAVSDTVEAA